MTNSKLAVIGGSGLYDMEGLKNPKWKKLKLHGEILQMKY